MRRSLLSLSEKQFGTDIQYEEFVWLPFDVLPELIEASTTQNTNFVQKHTLKLRLVSAAATSAASRSGYSKPRNFWWP